MIIKKIRSAILVIFLAAACSAQPISLSPTQTPQKIATQTQEQREPTSAPTPASPAETLSVTATLTPTSEIVIPADTATPTAVPETAEPQEVKPGPGGAIIVDHTSVDLFEQIPEQYLAAARDLRVLYADRSVGFNIDQALNCLTANQWPESLNYCRVDYSSIEGSAWKFKTYTLRDFQDNNVPARILFTPDPVKYDRSNIEFVNSVGGNWEELIQKFVLDLVPANLERKDILSFQFTYLNVEEGATIDDPVNGFFSDQPHHGFYTNRERWDISDLEELESQYPEKTFFYWTTSLARSIGTEDATTFNNQMRQYAIDHNKILFDVADIESHDDKGNPCYDNRDGVEYCGTQGCENFPDDQQNIAALCQDYTTEIMGGHLGSTSAGHLRIAKAFWVLLARIAGWDGQ